MLFRRGVTAPKRPRCRKVYAPQQRRPKNRAGVAALECPIPKENMIFPKSILKSFWEVMMVVLLLLGFHDGFSLIFLFFEKFQSKRAGVMK